jgi:uncharacterized membrane protein YeaQ/YmgE (transglycosylase-associated protein family)
VLIFAIIGLGCIAGYLANAILGGGMFPDNWGEVLIAGVAGSFVGGLIVSLLSGDGLAIRPSGIIGSIVGAVIVLVVWRAVKARR